MKPAGLEAVNREAIESLNEIVAKYEPFRRIRSAPIRFRVSKGHEKVRLNSSMYMDIVYLDVRPVLHLFDEATRFSAARFLANMTTDSVWDAILIFWSSIYTELPNTMLVDA